MKKHEQELKSYINSTERMSGMNGYDSYDEESMFDDDGMPHSSFDDDDMSFASGGGHTPVEGISDPYIIQYENTTTDDVTAIFMGYNDNSLLTNFGNPTAVVLTNLQGGSYARLIAQSNSKNFVVGKWRFSASGSNIVSQLDQTLILNHVDGNGQNYQKPINMSVMKDLFQFSTNAIDITKRVTFDGNTFITFTLKASATLVLAAYPVVVLSGKAVLNGGSEVNRAIAPRLSGKNVAPVIIQTTQDVRGITKG